MGTREALYKLLRIAIGNESDLSLPGNVNLTELMDLSVKVDINGLAVSGLQKMTDEGFDLSASTKDSKEQRMTWIGLSMMLEQKSTLQWRAIQRLVELYAQNGITTIVLKGMSVAQWYPTPMMRSCCDFDCFLLKRAVDGTIDFAYEEGNKIVEKNGIYVDRNIYVHSVFEYKELVVENHHYLAAVKLGKRHQKMDKTLRDLLIAESLQPVLDSKLMMGSPMFNAVFLTHHAHHHMLHGVMPIKLLTDWALFIKNNTSMEWERYWDYMEEFGMLRFAQSMTRLSCRLMGARVQFNLPADDEADRLFEESMWAFPIGNHKKKTLFTRRIGMISSMLHARKKYKVFYDCSSLQMVVAYVKGYFFGEVD